MRKLFALILIVFLIPVCSFAVDLTEFNVNAIVLGEEAIDESTELQAGGFITYSANGCKIGIKEENNEIVRFVVQGDGIPFIAYSMAAIMVIDNNDASFSENAGKLMTSFFLLRSSDEQYNVISTGQVILLKHINGEYFFTIGR